MTSIFEGTQPPKTRPFPIKTRVSWVPGIDISDISNGMEVFNLGFSTGSHHVSVHPTSNITTVGLFEVASRSTCASSVSA